MTDNKEKTDKNARGADYLNRLIFNMIEELPERSRNIIIKRFNLDNKGVKTLDEIGKEYKITRERVRQIEVEAMAKLKNMKEKYKLDEVFDYVEKIIKNHGEIISEEKIINILSDGGFRASKQVALLILLLNDKIKTAKETEVHKKIYFYKKESVLSFEKILKELENYLREKNESVDFDKIAEFINKSAQKYNLAAPSLEIIESYLEANKVILKNILGEWGCEKWARINPKNVKNKAYLSLKKNKKPLHFTKIAEEINAIWPQKRKTNSQTAHNELIKDDRFVLVGRGIYALKEWGYKPGTVLDVIMEILKKENRKMGQEEIIEEVLKRRQVKRNTIILNLQNKKYFEKMDGKVYRLK